MSPALTALSDTEFSATIGSLPTPAAVRRYLARSPHVAEIRRDLSSGNLTEAAVRGFITEMMRDLRPGERFVHEPAVAALCVALETNGASFAEEYTNDLANLALAEMPTAIRVARLSREERARTRQPTGPIVDTCDPTHAPAHEARS